MLSSLPKIFKTMIQALYEKRFFEVKEIIGEVEKLTLITDCWTSVLN